MPQSPNFHARELQRNVSQELEILQRIPQQVADLLGELRRDTDRLRRSGDLTAGAKTRYARELRDTAAMRLESLIEEADEARRHVEAEAKRTLDRPDTGDPAEQLLHELQLQRAWARTQRLLSSNATIPDVIAQAAKNRDAAMFDALRAEADAWLVEHGADSREIEAVHALIAEHEDVVLPPDKIAAKTARKDAERHAYYGGMAIGQAREELTGGPQWSEMPAGPEATIKIPDDA